MIINDYRLIVINCLLFSLYYDEGVEMFLLVLQIN